MAFASYNGRSNEDYNEFTVPIQLTSGTILL